MSTKKHMVLEDRKQIEILLNQNQSYTSIAKALGRSTSTISREVKANRTENRKVPYGRIPNRCKKARTCLKRDICSPCIKKADLCCRCSLCNRNCPEYEEQKCSRLMRAPFVCNACSQSAKCTLVKQFYRADKAQKSYEFLLSEARSGFNITEAEIKDLNEIMDPLIRQGQSIEHILMSNPDTIMYSARSIYTYTRAGLLTFKNWDLPHIMKMKPRTKKSTPLKVDKKCRIGRTWEDYVNFRNEDELLDISPVEIDSVIGSRGGKVLLTIMFTNCNFMLAFLRNRNNSQSVIDCFNYLDALLGRQIFMMLFPVILADNGSEFSNPAAIEFAPDGLRRTRLFYCDPMSPYQKPRVEQNHTFIRRILPKGSSFDSLSQHDIDLVMSHVNSCKRTALNGKSPFEAFSLLYGEQILNLFPYKIIDPRNIVLRPSLLH